ncbi:alpha-amylase family glycosyl hydrolase [Spirochaeta africana]|uniref:Glycosidase n=1 Tax=Spirochaeta africana (strain ATCC 700263 / DSM 8902 / Z-7692) TaxID=889378 RepID=H9UGZ7_SPIAZ|nr:alpha-amylase family glycosyl hydrolase [Spirochaeta africana]AFG36790.1 glycosidase [Spirochaeta africana DSM 8902]
MRKTSLFTLMTAALAAVVFLAACASDAPATRAPSPARARGPAGEAQGNPDFPPVAIEAPEELPEFSWDNATVYFVMTDRFYDGDPSNNDAYGRLSDVPDDVPDTGLFHGGDLAGLTQKLEEGYFTDLGVNALWITSPLEQVHGWVGGGDGGFPHYAYHGYYHQDWTMIDRNMGTKEDFGRFMEAAHANGIRVVMDIVMNHPGYNTVKDMVTFDFGAWKDEELPVDWVPTTGNWHQHHDFIDYDGQADRWARWWGPDWVRAGIADYPRPGFDDLTESLEFLPDMITESTEPVDLPPFLLEKAERGESRVQPIEGATVREYLITWLTDWVREYGIDGFRIDTAKHVEMDAWVELKERATIALREWKAENPEQALDDADFWFTGEVWGHGPNKTEYHANGFDSMINFSFQGFLNENLDDFAAVERLYQSYADVINNDAEMNLLSYISGHDVPIFFDTSMRINAMTVTGARGDHGQQMRAGTALLLLPGGVQIYYGDEVGRSYERTPEDPAQGTRTPFPWDRVGNDIHQHWQTVGQFRNRNIAVGAGQHISLTADSGVAFARDYFGMNTIVAVLDSEGDTTIQVGEVFEDGTVLFDAYNEAEATVAGGQVTFNAGPNGVILLETR